MLTTILAFNANNQLAVRRTGAGVDRAWSDLVTAAAGVLSRPGFERKPGGASAHLEIWR